MAVLVDNNKREITTIGLQILRQLKYLLHEFYSLAHAAPLCPIHKVNTFLTLNGKRRLSP